MERIRNPYFWTGMVALFLATLGIDPITVSTWGDVKDLLIAFILNPYQIGLVIVAFMGVFVDPTTSGLRDHNYMADEELSNGRAEDEQ